MTKTSNHIITIPQNLFVVRTVNMDESTFSFSRKNLYRTEKPLTELKKLMDEQIVNTIPTPEDGSPKPTSITAKKIAEMLAKLKASSFTSYWT